MPIEGEKHEAEHQEASDQGGEGAALSWEQLCRRRLQEGWQEGPSHRQPAVRGGDVGRKPLNGKRPEAVSRSAEDLIRKETLPEGRNFEGVVTDVPFDARRIRSKSWYGIYSLRASSLLQFERFGRKIIFNFHGVDLKQLYPVLQTLARLPYLLHKKFEGRKRISAREYDKAAKEMLNAQGDVFGKTGALQAVLAYWRAYLKMQAARKPGDNMHGVNLVLNIKTTRRGAALAKRSGSAPALRSGPKQATTIAIPKALQHLPDVPPGLPEKQSYGPYGGGNLPRGVNLFSTKSFNLQWEIVTVGYADGRMIDYRRRKK